MGKIIVFWSPLHGQARVTASMSAVAMALSESQGERVVMTHTQYSMADMESMFNLRLKTEQKQMLYDSAGLNALLLNFKQSELSEDVVERCAMQIPYTHNLYMLPGLTKDMAALQGDELDDILEHILTKHVTKAYDWVLIDLSSGKNTFSQKMIEKADVIVVTLSQNTGMWDMVFNEYPEIAKSDKTFFLFGSHKSVSKFNVKNFRRRYREYANGNNSGVIPDCVGYMDAISNGLISTFYLMNEFVKEKEENHSFIAESKESAKKISALAHKEDKTEVRLKINGPLY